MGEATRRRFLAALFSGAAVAMLAWHRVLQLVRPPAAAADDAAPSAPLTGDERQTLVAFAALLLPSTVDAAAEIEHVIDDHAADDAFRETAQLLNERSTSLHQVPFPALDPSRRDAIVNDILAPVSADGFRARINARLTRDGRRSRRVWSSVALPILAHFYESRLGWGIVGYAHRPGECSNLTDYQEPPAGAAVS